MAYGLPALGQHAMFQGEAEYDDDEERQLLEQYHRHLAVLPFFFFCLSTRVYYLAHMSTRVSYVSMCLRWSDHACHT